MVSTILGIALVAQCACGSISTSQRVVFHGPLVVESGGMHNIRISFEEPIDGALSLHYGSCNMSSSDQEHHRIGTTHVGNHRLARRHERWERNRPTRFVWLPPQNSPDGGCLHAYSHGQVIGTSAPVTMVRKKVRRNISFADVADPQGPWFDGVEYLKNKEPDSIFVSQTKAKSIGIIGGGMSGLMTAYLLDSVGMHNWKILEGSKRLGGRVYTNYFNGTKPEDYQYQEMGGMRIPVSIKYAGTNETLQIQDHQMVFNLAEALNVMNGNDSSLEIKFVPWIQSSANDPALTSKRRPDGTIPGDAEVKANHSLADSGTATYSNATAVTAARTSFVQWVKLKERMADIATNVFRAHKKAIQDGLFDYSEAMYLRDALDVNVNIADQAVTSGSADFVPSWPYESVYFAATEWKTIDKGLSKLPAAFGPLVSNRTSLGVKVQELSWDEDRRKIRAHWRPKDPFTIESESEEYDYAIVSVPFTRVRLWKLPAYSPLMLRAINTMNYRAACKVALQYKTHFWEKLPQPIFGGCGEVNIPAVGSICYPSYQINSSLPGILLGSYVKGAMARAVGSLSEMDHVALVQRAMIETHGIIAQEQYTGAFDRVCWEQEELSGGAWCDPVVGQQELFLPAYYQTDKNTIFVGEHTSFTHGWIFSALESAVRGTVQLLLDMGLVDEAKQVTNTWMARWLKM